MKMITMKTGIALFLFAAALPGALYAPALAQGTAEQRSDCIGDAFKFCSDDIPDVPKIEACLKAHEHELTPACRAEFEPTGRTKLQSKHFK